MELPTQSNSNIEIDQCKAGDAATKNTFMHITYDYIFLHLKCFIIINTYINFLPTSNNSKYRYEN